MSCTTWAFDWNESRWRWITLNGHTAQSALASRFNWEAVCWRQLSARARPNLFVCCCYTSPNGSVRNMPNYVELFTITFCHSFLRPNSPKYVGLVICLLRAITDLPDEHNWCDGTGTEVDQQPGDWDGRRARLPSSLSGPASELHVPVSEWTWRLWTTSSPLWLGHLPLSVSQPVAGTDLP